MTATYNLLLISLAGMAIGWILALRALTELGPWGPLAGLAFLGLVIAGLIRAAEV
ncbi:MAG: hypothetical protein QN183_08195 [Armatimonadota bacterium]|nr:hypothetical protein [Armatimonadota bacterium]MDR7532678.1 hypothetical protein [Armatimonadota bacterium]MDR7536329.1 hypothetical protein [Armatimonadota bacterium]